MNLLRADLGWSLSLSFIFNMAACLGLLKFNVDLSDNLRILVLCIEGCCGDDLWYLTEP